MKTISIIGYGPFAKLMIRHLQDDYRILVYSRNPEGKTKEGLRFAFVPLEEALRQEVIVLGLPAQFLSDFLRDNAHLMNPNALVLDVASVKINPIDEMKKLLPPTCQIIGTHPIFGPGSAKNGIAGLRIVLCPVRCDASILSSLRQYLQQKGLIVLEKTPEAHDEAMAYVLGLTQYLGRALQAIDAHDTELTTPAYEELMKMRAIQGNDSWDLFYSILRENPYAKEVSRNLRNALDELDAQLDAKETPAQHHVKTSLK